MSRYSGPMCDLDYESESEDPDEGDLIDILDLRLTVKEFDTMMTTCWEDELTPQESERLNRLHVVLNEKEESYWEGVPHEAVGLIQNHLDLDFPIIRYLLGMIPLVRSASLT